LKKNQINSLLSAFETSVDDLKKRNDEVFDYFLQLKSGLNKQNQLQSIGKLK